MSCDEFDRRLEARGSAGVDAGHARECPRCGRRAKLVLTLSSLPGVDAPAGLDARVRGAFAAERHRRVVFRLTRVAAAVLLFVLGTAGTLAWLDGDAPRALDLRVVNMPPAEDADEEVAIEEIYGPATPVVDAEGGGGDAIEPR